MHIYINMYKTPSLNKKINMHAYILNMHRIIPNTHEMVLLQMVLHTFALVASILYTDVAHSIVSRIVIGPGAKIFLIFSQTLCI